MEYIEREKLRDALYDADAITMRGVAILNRFPAADVVPVVRCKDCKHAHMTYDGLCKYCDELIEHGVEETVYLPVDYFCADGERKDGDGDV